MKVSFDLPTETSLSRICFYAPPAEVEAYRLGMRIPVQLNTTVYTYEVTSVWYKDSLDMYEVTLRLQC